MLSSGDSGSWVIDKLTGEVMGHVVASDLFGDAYVVPIHAAFQQMKESLGADSVRLATKDDISKLKSSLLRSMPPTRAKTPEPFRSPSPDFAQVDSGYASKHTTPIKHPLLFTPRLSNFRV